MPLDLLHKKKIVEILCALLRGAKGVRELQRAVGGSNSNIYASIEECRAAGLVEDEYLTGLEFGEKPRGMRLIRLTSKARELTQSLIDSGHLMVPSLRKIRERWIIVILSLFKTVSGSTRLMKLLFLLKNELRFSKRELGSFYKFRPWKFGPFCKGVVKDLEELQDDGFVMIETRRLPPNEFSEDQKTLYIYKLTKAGEDVVQEALENLPHNALQRLSGLKAFNSMSLMDLLEYVYTRYPRFITESTIVETILGNRSQ